MSKILFKTAKIKAVKSFNGENKNRESQAIEETPRDLQAQIKRASIMDVMDDKKRKSFQSVDMSSSSYGGPSCPKVYEEIIQGLEADIRKHIRMEHQLKLHIESVEDRVEELEREMEKMDVNKSPTKTIGSERNPDSDDVKKALQKEISQLKSKHSLETKKLQLELNKSSEENSQLNEKVSKLEEDLRKQKSSLETEKKQVAQRKEENLGLNKQVNELKQQISQLIDKIETLKSK